MPAREWRGPGAADERARGRGRDRVDVSVENWVQDFQQRRTFGKTNRYISPTSSAHVWVLRRTRARAVLAASVASPHLRPRDTHRRRSSVPTEASGAVSTHALVWPLCALNGRRSSPPRGLGSDHHRASRSCALSGASRGSPAASRVACGCAASVGGSATTEAHRGGCCSRAASDGSQSLRDRQGLRQLRHHLAPARAPPDSDAVADEVRRHEVTPPGRRGRGPRGAGSGAASSRRRTRGRTARR